jgi:hypothetical protein
MRWTVRWAVRLAIFPAVRRRQTPFPLAGASLNLEQENKDGRSQREYR